MFPSPDEDPLFHRAYALVLDCYPPADSFIPDEDPILNNQLCRCLLSIPVVLAGGTRGPGAPIVCAEAAAAVQEVDVIVALCCDLGYLHDDIASFLHAELHLLREDLLRAAGAY